MNEFIYNNNKISQKLFPNLIHFQIKNFSQINKIKVQNLKFKKGKFLNVH